MCQPIRLIQFSRRATASARNAARLSMCSGLSQHKNCRMFSTEKSELRVCGMSCRRKSAESRGWRGFRLAVKTKKLGACSRVACPRLKCDFQISGCEQIDYHASPWKRGTERTRRCSLASDAAEKIFSSGRSGVSGMPCAQVASLSTGYIPTDVS